MIGQILLFKKLIQEGIFSRVSAPISTYFRELRVIPGQIRKTGIRSTWKENKAFRHTIQAKGGEAAVYGAYKTGYKRGKKETNR